VKLAVYLELAKLNLGFDIVIESLAALRRHRGFHEGELDRYSDWSKEVRSATTSYLTGAVEAAETTEAGRRYRRRRTREKKDEQET
jgi:hypothetical protein